MLSPDDNDILEIIDLETVETGHSAPEEEILDILEYYQNDSLKTEDSQTINLVILSNDLENSSDENIVNDFEIEDLFFDNHEGSKKIDKLKPVKISKAEKKVITGINKPRSMSRTEELIIKRAEEEKGFISEEEKFVILELDKIKKEKLKRKRKSKKKKKLLDNIKSFLGEDKTNLFLRLNKKIKELERELKTQKKQEPPMKRGKWKRSTQELEAAELDSIVLKSSEDGKFTELNKNTIEMLLSIGQIENVGQLRICKVCNKNFYATAYDVNRGKATLCSKECGDRSNP